jgi:polyisoprenyl-phosphate glycosyltransferase
MLSVVIPVYRNQAFIPELVGAIGRLHETIEGGLEAVFVVDGSPDRCFELLQSTLPSQGFPSRLATLSRNFGAFPAIRAGLTLGRGDRFAVMAADLQEPPELIVTMDRMLREDQLDVVVGVREDRHDPPMNRIPAQVFWAMYRRFVMPQIPPGGVDVFACNRAFRDRLLTLEERHSSLIGQLFWMGYRRGSAPYVRLPRRYERSSWSMSKKIEYLMDSVFSFTDLPIRLLVRVGGLVTVGTVLVGLVAAVLHLGGVIVVPPLAALALLMLFLGAVNLCAIGVVGIYAWRAYENTKARPIHIVRECLDFGPGPCP